MRLIFRFFPYLICCYRILTIVVRSVPTLPANTNA